MMTKTWLNPPQSRALHRILACSYSGTSIVLASNVNRILICVTSLGSKIRNVSVQETRLDQFGGNHIGWTGCHDHGQVSISLCFVELLLILGTISSASLIERFQAVGTLLRRLESLVSSIRVKFVQFV
jgi:hypothetical protein